MYANMLQFYSFISLELKIIKTSYKTVMFGRISSQTMEEALMMKGVIIRLNMVNIIVEIVALHN